jgi:hypothetical protein
MVFKDRSVLLVFKDLQALRGRKDLKEIPVCRDRRVPWDSVPIPTPFVCKDPLDLKGCKEYLDKLAATG